MIVSTVSEVLTDLEYNIENNQTFQKNDKTLDREEGDAFTDCVKISHATTPKTGVTNSNS